MEDIKAIIDDPAFDAETALREQLENFAKKAQPEILIDNVRKTLASREGE